MIIIMESRITGKCGQCVQTRRLQNQRNRGSPVKPGLMLLDYIKDNGFKCAVATSTQKSSAEKSLHRIGAWDYSSGVVYGDEVGTWKA